MVTAEYIACFEYLATGYFTRCGSKYPLDVGVTLCGLINADRRDCIPRLGHGEWLATGRDNETGVERHAGDGKQSASHKYLQAHAECGLVYMHWMQVK